MCQLLESFLTQKYQIKLRLWAYIYLQNHLQLLLKRKKPIIYESSEQRTNILNNNFVNPVNILEETYDKSTLSNHGLLRVCKIFSRAEESSWNTITFPIIFIPDEKRQQVTLICLRRPLVTIVFELKPNMLQIPLINHRIHQIRPILKTKFNNYPYFLTA